MILLPLLGSGASGCGSSLETPSAAQASVTDAPASNAPPTASIDVAAMVRDAQDDFRHNGGSLEAVRSAYRLTASPDGGLRVESSKAPAAPLIINTTAIARGKQAVALHAGGWQGQGPAQLRLARAEGIDEQVRAGSTSFEQSWRFDRAPAGAGDLELRVAVSGAAFTQVTAGGMHFRAPGSRGGFRYSHATWVDAQGRKTPIEVRYADGALSLRVPSSTLEQSSYPAVLDPTVGPEVELDVPIFGATDGDQGPTSIAYNAATYYVTWIDTRSGYQAVGARIGTNGALLDRGTALTPASSTELRNLSVARAGGGFVVAWQQGINPGYGTGTWDIFSRRIASDGALLEATPTRVDPKVGVVANPRVAGDATTFAIVYEDLAAKVVRARRFNAATGAALDGGPLPLPAPTGADQQYAPETANNGSSYLVGWSSRSECPGGGFYCNPPTVRRFTRISAAGAVLDPATIVVDSGPSLIASDGTDYLLVWYQPALSYGGSSFFRSRRFFADGTLGAVQTFDTFNNTGSPAPAASGLAYDGTRYLFVWTWPRYVNFDYQGDIRARRLAQDGTSLDATHLVLAGTDLGEGAAGVAGSPAGFLALIGRAPSRYAPVSEVYSSRVSGAGVLLDAAPVLVTATANRQNAPKVAFNGQHYLVVWEDARGIYGTRIAADGTLVSPAAFSIATGSVYKPAVASDGTDFLVVWQVNSAATCCPPPPYGIQGARVTGGGAVQASFVVSGAANDQTTPAVAFDGTNYHVVWEDNRAVQYGKPRIYGTRVSPAGVVLNPAGYAIGGPVGGGTDTAAQTKPAVAAGTGQVLVVWERALPSPSTYTKIAGARVAADGTVLDAAGLAISKGALSQTAPSVASDGTNFMVAWQDERNDLAGPDVYAARVTAAGAVSDVDGVPISTADGAQRAPAVTYAGASGLYLATWQDERNPVDAIRGTWITREARVLDPDGRVISEGAGAEGSVASCRGRTGEVLVTYVRKDPAAGSDRIRARLSSAGKDQGDTCSKDDDCGMRFCTDGVCCGTRCDEACRTCSATKGTCTVVEAGPDPVCGGGSVCTTGGLCKASLAQPCATGADCESGFCADGVCCNTACNGGCDVCNATPGTCTVLPRGATGASPSCLPNVCDGVSATCPGACTNDLGCSRGSYCAGNGTCRAACASDADCTSGDACDTATGKCVARASCADTRTATNNTGARIDCAPYICEGQGCRATCRSAADCIAPALCDEGGRCVEPPAPGVAATSGCSAAGTGNPEGRAPWVLTFGLVALLGLRRRSGRSS